MATIEKQHGPTYREDDSRIIKMAQQGLSSAQMVQRGYSKERVLRVLKVAGFKFKPGAGWTR